MNAKKNSRVVAYIRVSTDDQADRGISLAAQREKVKQYCTLYDLQLVTVVKDCKTAKNMDRPGLQRALALLESGKADVLLVTKLDRLTRSIRDLSDLLEDYFDSGGWGLVSMAESVDTTTAAGELVLNVLVSVAQWERKAIGERTRDALAHLKGLGVRNGRPGMGWKYSDETDEHGRRKIVTDRSEAATVKVIARLREDGQSYGAIARELEKRERKTKRGGNWTPATVRRIYIRQNKAASAY